MKSNRMLRAQNKFGHASQTFPWKILKKQYGWEGTLPRFRINPSQVLHVHTAAFRTDPYIEIPDCLEQFRYGQILIPAFKSLISLQLEDQFQVFGFHPVVEKSIVADPLKSMGKHMHQETPDEFFIFQRYLPPVSSGVLCPGGKCSFGIRNRKDPAV